MNHTAAGDVCAVPDFDTFASDATPRLRRALTARYGVQVGTEACAAALAYAWEHRERVMAMKNPLGYLWRVAQTNVRRQHRWQRRWPMPAEQAVLNAPEGSPSLATALAQLKPDVRVAVVLVHSFAWSYAEVAELLGVPVSTVRNHVHRGLGRLRQELELEHDH